MNQNKINYKDFGYDRNLSKEIRRPADPLSRGDLAGGDLSGIYPRPMVVWANGQTTFDGRYLKLAGGTLTDDITLSDGVNIIIDTTNGTKIGTGTTQKISFYGVTPVVQSSAYTPTNVTADRSYDANTVDVAELADIVGTLISDLQGLGLVG